MKQLTWSVFQFLILAFIALALLVIIDSSLINYSNNEDKHLGLSPVFVIAAGLSIRLLFRSVVLKKEIKRSLKITSIIVVMLVMLNTFSLFSKNIGPNTTYENSEIRKQNSQIITEHIPAFMAQSIAISLPEIAIATIPVIGIPLVFSLGIWGVAEERAVQEGKNPRDADFMKTLVSPAWI